MPTWALGYRVHSFFVEAVTVTPLKCGTHESEALALEYMHKHAA